MPRKTTKAQEALIDERSKVMTQSLLPKKKNDEQEVVSRPTALDFKKTEKLKELILQDVSRGRTQTAIQYTKSLVKQYLQNPTSYRTQLVGVSRFLYRMSTLYKKIILYYATMPLYNYNITEKMDIIKDNNIEKLKKNYQDVLLATHHFNIKNEFATAIAIAIRDGIYCGYFYQQTNGGQFLHMLPMEYYRIRGKNEDGQWVVAFDATYFAVGQNRIFVEGIDGDTSGCWDSVFIEGYQAYQQDRANRWFLLPPDKTLVLLANLQDDFESPLPFYTGLMIPVLDELDMENIVAEKAELDNFYLLLLKIPTLNGGSGDVVDDFSVSLEIGEAYKNAISEIMPSLSGTALLPGMDWGLLTFNKANSQTDESMIAEATNTIFSQAGANQLVVSSGNSTSNYAIKMSIANDLAYTSLLLSRLEFNYQYYIDKNIGEGTIFKIHRQTYYNEDEYLQRVKDSSTLGGPAMRFLTAQGMTPYEAYSAILFESAIGLKSIMEPLESSYQRTNGSNDVGRPTSDSGDLSGSGQRTRDADSTIAE